ncbi:hypothetical protein ABTK55_19690, partial [Acinetobacter baumannii]
PAARQVVVLNRQLARIKAQCFSADHLQGGVQAARALLQHRHRDIAIVSGPATSPDKVARLAGLMGELAQHGLDTSGILTLPGDLSKQ